MCGVTYSQKTISNQFGMQVSVGGGLHSLLFDPQEGVSKHGIGGLFDAQFQYFPFFDERMGLGFGIKISSLNSSAIFNYRYEQHKIMLPSALYPCDYYVKFKDWREYQHIIMLSVPIQFIFKDPIIANKVFLQVGGGFSLDFPISATYEANEGSYIALGHMEVTNITYQEDLEDYHLGLFHANEKGKSVVPMNISLIGDLGTQFVLKRSCDLYMGVYVDYGVLNSGRTIFHDIITDYQYRGILNSGHVSKANPIEIGIKIGVHMGWEERNPPIGKGSAPILGHDVEDNESMNFDDIERAKDRAKTRAEKEGVNYVDENESMNLDDIKKAKERAKKRGSRTTSGS